jgi:threonine/homoserine/homoserine lactone efflux protein
METWPLVASAVRLVGAAYMAWLGVQLIRGWFANKQTALSTPKPASASYSRLVLIGAANNLLNPKALLFFSFFLPQFVNPAMGKPSLQLFLLGLMLSVTAFVFNVLLALTASALRRFDLGAAPLQRHSGGLLGGLFMLLAARLALAKPA